MSRAGLLLRENGLDASQATTASEARIAGLVETHFDFVWQVLRRFGLPPADADDAAQQVFVIAARKLSSIETGRERAFLYGTARRVLANVRRGIQRRRDTEDAAIDDDGPAQPPPDELVERNRARALLDELLLELPDELRRALVLAEIEQMTNTEIAALEDIPVGTAASRLRRARETFRELLGRARAKNPFATVGD